MLALSGGVRKAEIKVAIPIQHPVSGVIDQQQVFRLICCALQARPNGTQISCVEHIHAVATANSRTIRLGENLL